MSQFGLVVRFALKPGCAEAFDALMRETVAGIAAHEPRTLAYAVHALEAEPDVREVKAEVAALLTGDARERGVGGAPGLLKGVEDIGAAKKAQV